MLDRGMTLPEIIAKLETSVAAKNDPTYAATHAFHDGDAVTADELDAQEKTLIVRRSRDPARIPSAIHDARRG